MAFDDKLYQKRMEIIKARNKSYRCNQCYKKPEESRARYIRVALFWFLLVVWFHFICKATYGGKKKKGRLGTPHTPAKGCRPLHSRFSLRHLRGDWADRDTPHPGKGLPPSALPLCHCGLSDY
jgi:hypothetical protein